MTFSSQRLTLSEFELTDAGFILELINDPDFIRFIGDKKVRSIADAEEYITSGPMKSYTENGFGLWKVSLMQTGMPIGMCGLIRRETLPAIDIGYAFLPAFRAQGYAFEAAFACKEYARLQLKVDSLCGIVNPENHRSIKVLTQLGMHFERSLRMQGADHDVNLYLERFSG